MQIHLVDVDLDVNMGMDTDIDKDNDTDEAFPTWQSRVRNNSIRIFGYKLLGISAGSLLHYSAVRSNRNIYGEVKHHTRS